MTNRIEKHFNFKKGLEDYKTWSKVNDFIFNFFHNKRRYTYRIAKLKTNYKITVIIEKYQKLKKE